MSRRVQIYFLIVLLAVLVLLFRFYRPNQEPPFGVFAAGNVRYQSLNVEDPSLRLDLLERIHKLEYTGTHRDIFSSAPLPVSSPASPRGKNGIASVPKPPPGPPPIVVPATFFGYASNPQTGKRQAFFTNGEDVFVVEEGGILLRQFRLLKIGNNTAELEQISDGRRTTVNMEQPAAN